MSSIEKKRVDILKRKQQVAEVYASASACISEFKSISRMLTELNARKPEIEALGNLLRDMDTIRVRQGRCFDFLNQDKAVLLQVRIV